MSSSHVIDSDFDEQDAFEQAEIEDIFDQQVHEEQFIDEGPYGRKRLDLKVRDREEDSEYGEAYRELQIEKELD